MPLSGNGLDFKHMHLIKTVNKDISTDHEGHEGGRWGQAKRFQFRVPLTKEGKRAVSVRDLIMCSHVAVFLCSTRGDKNQAVEVGSSCKGHQAGVGSCAVMGGEHHMQLLLQQTAQLRGQLLLNLWIIVLVLPHNSSAKAAQAQIENVREKRELVPVFTSDLYFSRPDSLFLIFPYSLALSERYVYHLCCLLDRKNAPMLHRR